MDIIALFQNLIQNPYAPKSYRDLQRYYAEAGMQAEADAFAVALEHHRRRIESTDDTHPDEGQ